MTTADLAHAPAELRDPGRRLDPRVRDGRIDMLRGLALLVIFIDHVPRNSLSLLTLHCFGFSDAAEIFVLLAGYSTYAAYNPVFEARGTVAGCAKVARRCATIWGAHAVLLLGSVAIVMLRYRLTGRPPTLLAPLIADGGLGLLRGLTLQALPAYLDILPLYIALLAALPLVLFGLRRSPGLTLTASVVLHVLATVSGWNLPNQIDARLSPGVWTFNPFAWQLIFVIGALMAQARGGARPRVQPLPGPLRAACLGILVYAFVAIDAWDLWPGLSHAICPAMAFDPRWKMSAAPWRVLHSLALVTLLLHSRTFSRLSDLPSLAAVKACGRFSLPVFSAGCLLALGGRIAFSDLGTGPAVQLAVNGLGLAAQLVFVRVLQRGSLSLSRRTAAATVRAEVPA